MFCALRLRTYRRVQKGVQETRWEDPRGEKQRESGERVWHGGQLSLWLGCQCLCRLNLQSLTACSSPGLC